MPFLRISTAVTVANTAAVNNLQMHSWVNHRTYFDMFGSCTSSETTYCGITRCSETTANNMRILEWTARIRCDEHELGGSFSVLIFLGEVPDDPKQWATSASCVGIHDVYTSRTSARDHSASQADAEVEGFVPLNEGLLEHSGANELTPDVVLPFLKNHLCWRVQDVSSVYHCDVSFLKLCSVKMKGTAAQMLSLEIVVLATPISQVPGETFPVVGEPHFYHDVTRVPSGEDPAML